MEHREFLAGRGAGGHLWQSVYGNGWSTPLDLSTTWTTGQMLQSAPSAAVAPDGQQVVFWEGADGVLMEAWLAGSTWYGPANIAAAWGGSAPVTSAPAVAVRADGTQFVYWGSPTGHLWEASYATSWSAPVDLTGRWGGQGLVGSAPSLAMAADGSQSVFWEGADHHAWEAWLKGGSWNGPADFHETYALNTKEFPVTPFASRRSAIVPPSMSQSTSTTERVAASDHARLVAQDVDVWPARVVQTPRSEVTDWRPRQVSDPNTPGRTECESLRWHSEGKVRASHRQR